ncbi:MAG: hypothetical protein ACI9MC_002864 [Kiritimatiellia bacterium]|jgi:hypothetical protein
MSNLDAMKTFFKSEDWFCETSDNGEMLRARFKGENGEWLCLLQTTPDDTRVMFYSILSNNVPEAKRGVVSELLSRANYGMILGNWEIDFADGEVRYKTSAFTGDGEIQHDLAAAMVFTNVLTTDKYMPAILGVALGW